MFHLIYTADTGSGNEWTDDDVAVLKKLVISKRQNLQYNSSKAPMYNIWTSITSILNEVSEDSNLCNLFYFQILSKYVSFITDFFAVD